MITDQPASPEPQATPFHFDYEAWLAEDAKRRAAFAEELADLKTNLFDTLEARGIVLVTVAFDGCGDSGQIEGVYAIDEHGSVELTGITLPPPTGPSDSIADPDPQGLIADAIETLAYDLLESEHGGWENNDGAYGEFTFDVVNRTIALEHNQRFTSSELYTHEW